MVKRYNKIFKKSQTLVVAGLQYVVDNTNNRAYNYLLTIVPFSCGDYGYKNAFVYIREKNDYSPIEKKMLSNCKYQCADARVAQYQIYRWNDIDIATMLCYEMTDIVARALLKGTCDIVASSEFNRDTTYFSNIVDTMARDNHAFIVQSNTSIYGDSRVTGPFSRDIKDIFKIKGGENDNVLIGYINWSEFVNFQKKYYANLQSMIINRDKEKNNIKPFSARFHNRRSN